jgi:hypothetical protein
MDLPFGRCRRHTPQPRVTAPSGGGRKSGARASERRISGGGTPVERGRAVAISPSLGPSHPGDGGARGSQGPPTRNLLRLRLANCRPPPEGYGIHTSRPEAGSGAILVPPLRLSSRFGRQAETGTHKHGRRETGPVPRQSRSAGCLWVPDWRWRAIRDDKWRGCRMCESDSPEGAVGRLPSRCEMSGSRSALGRRVPG